MSEDSERPSWAGKAAIAAGAAIGSAAIAAALLYASRRKDKRDKAPKHSQNAQDTD